MGVETKLLKEEGNGIQGGNTAIQGFGGEEFIRDIQDSASGWLGYSA